MSALDHTLDQTQLCQLMGYESPGAAEKKLREQGIVPIYGRAGHFFVTLTMLNAARGVGAGAADNYAAEELL